MQTIVLICCVIMTVKRRGEGVKILRTYFMNGPIGRWEGAWKFLLNNLVACSLFLGTLYRPCRSIGRQFFKNRDSFHFFADWRAGELFPPSYSYSKCTIDAMARAAFVRIGDLY